MIGKTGAQNSRVWKKCAAALALALSLGVARGATLCVWTNSPHPGAPYDAWTNAAHEIQTAVDAAQPGDTVLVTNGLYNSGSRVSPTHTLSNRVVISTSIVVRSVNGPAVTVIRGRAAGETVERRCVYISGGGQLNGFTLTNGSACASASWLDRLGGGALIERSGSISNCVVCSNSATYGGGIAAYYGGEVRNCFVYGNAAAAGSWYYGGGFYGTQGAAVYDSMFSNNFGEVGGGISLEGNCRVSRCAMIGNLAGSGGGLSLKSGDIVDNCLIVSNVATKSGGGVSFSAGVGALRCCTVVGNTAQLYPDHSGTYHVTGGSIVNSILVQNGDGSQNLDASLNYEADHLCTTPWPSNGTGHVTADPLLQSDGRPGAGSPCIDAGSTNGPGDDFAGVARPLDGNNDGTNAWDIGAFEYLHPLGDSDGDGLRDTNEVALGTSPILFDTDGDTMGDNAEIRAGTDALDAGSFLYLRALAVTNLSSGFLVTWPGVAGRHYRLERTTNLSSGAFADLVRTNIPGVSPMNVETDVTAVGSGPWLYRIRLE